MAAIQIYQFQETVSGAGFQYIKYSVFRDSSNYNIITTSLQVRAGLTWGLPEKSSFVEGQPVGTPVCYGYDKVTYYFQSAAPYAYPIPEYNSPFCNFPTQPCDISYFGVPIVTHETGIGANNGSIQVFAQSSRTTDINYKIIGISGPYEDDNSTGKFYNLPPDSYSVIASEVGDITCAIDLIVSVNQFDPNFTTYKYRIQFDSIQGRNVEIRLLDTNNLYPIADYPIDLTTTETSVSYSKSLASEDKTERFAVANLVMDVYHNNLFTVDEFARAPEQVWRCEMYFNGELEFQGYLLPDEVKDEYKDPNYPIQLTATDGIPSLKGKLFSDLSLYTDDSNGDPVYQKLYGLKRWGYLMKICLEHLGYDYGDVTLLNSLQYDLTYDVDSWIERAVWGDIFYNDTDEPVSVYEALETLLSSFNLCIMQHKGSFVLMNWNDLYYIDKPAKATEYTDAFWRFNHDFTALVSYSIIVGSNPYERPPLLSIGKGEPLVPIGADGDVNYDQSYGVMEADIRFDILALYYADPSFEYGQTIGDIPNLFTKVGSINAFITDEQAYTGLNSLKISDDASSTNSDYIKYEFEIDQANKKLNISMFWKPIYLSENETVNPTIQIQLIGLNGKEYRYLGNGYPTEGWEEIPDIDNDTAVNAPNQSVEDYQAWNKYDVTTLVLPSPGTIRFTFKHPATQKLDPSGPLVPPGTTLNVYIDDLSLTTSDANDAYTFQTGELHRVSNYTSYSRAEKRTIELPLFTYPNNKRLAGNVFTIDDYLTGEVRDLYSFATSPSPVNEKLPAAVIKAISRNYQRPMYKYEDNIKGDNIQFYAAFTLVGYTAIFMPFYIETNLRNSVSRVVIVELDDSLAQARYNYVPRYEKNARKNSS